MYVLGINLPLMDILFIMFILIFIALIFIFFEIRKLYKLIAIEKEDVSQLDLNLKSLEYFINSNPSKELEKYIMKCLATKTPVDVIKKSLIKAGFHAETIDNIFAKLKKKGKVLVS